MIIIAAAARIAIRGPVRTGAGSERNVVEGAGERAPVGITDLARGKLIQGFAREAAKRLSVEFVE